MCLLVQYRSGGVWRTMDSMVREAIEKCTFSAAVQIITQTAGAIHPQTVVKNCPFS